MMVVESLLVRSFNRPARPGIVARYLAYQADWRAIFDLDFVPSVMKSLEAEVRVSSTPDFKTSINRLINLAPTTISSSAIFQLCSSHHGIVDLPSSLDIFSASPGPSNK
jgi:hypothetical protein